MDDVVGEVVLAVGDEDLLSGDPPRAVAGGHGASGEGADVGAGLRLGEVHRAGPLTGHHPRQVGLALLLVAVVQQHVDGALGEQRAQRERHVRRRHHLLDGDADEPREATAAVLVGERDRRPAGLDVAPVGLAESVRRRHRSVVVAPAVLHVADAVERGELLLEEPRRFLEDPVHRLRIGVLVTRQPGETGEVGDVLEDEAHVEQRCGVVAHGRQRYGGRPPFEFPHRERTTVGSPERAGRSPSARCAGNPADRPPTNPRGLHETPLAQDDDRDGRRRAPRIRGRLVRCGDHRATAGQQRAGEQRAGGSDPAGPNRRARRRRADCERPAGTEPAGTAPAGTEPAGSAPASRHRPAAPRRVNRCSPTTRAPRAARRRTPATSPSSRRPTPSRS